MRIKIAHLCIPMMALFIFACTTTKKKVERPPKIALENFFKNPQKTSYRISPEGTKFSYRAPFEDRMNIFVQEIGSKVAIFGPTIIASCI